MQRIELSTGWTCRHLNENEGAAVPVRLPHDAMLAEHRGADCASAIHGAYFAGADYLYQNDLFIPAEYAEKTLILEFEGVYRNAEIKINGVACLSRPYGYTNFYVPVSEFFNCGQTNRLEVIAHNAAQPNCRWYSGAGLYRPVHLYVCEPEHILLPGGIKLQTVGIEPPRLQVDVRTTGAGEVYTELLDGATVLAGAQAEADADGVARMVLTVPQAKLWRVEDPRLYTCRVRYKEDVQEVRAGLRTLTWDAADGFLLNGKREILRGACLHHDNGLLGACTYPEAERRRVSLLKENGYNAIRCAHNPGSKALLDACDELGMLVMDEYTDGWYIHKTRFDYADEILQWWRHDLKDMVEKDYNHPCVILYSTGNEVSETAQPKGIAFTKQMTEELHRLDPTRPVSCGINIFFNFLSSMGFGVYSDKKAEQQSAGGAPKKPVGSEFYNTVAGLLGAGFMKFGATLPPCDVKTRDAYANMDIAGYNYGIDRYAHDLRKYPDRLILGSETFCADAYDFWEQAKANNRLLGDFVWAGMDYIGEVSIGAWEYPDYAPAGSDDAGWITAGSGRIDLTGNPLGEALYTRVALEQAQGPFLAVRPLGHKGRHSPSAWKMTNAMESWSWRGCEGETATVEVYARAARVELLLNGKTVGSKVLHKACRAVFRLPYENGALCAVAYNAAGQELGRCTLQTAGEETRLAIAPETAAAVPDKLCYLPVRYTDDAGLWKPRERGLLRATVQGGELLAFGSACPYYPGSYQTPETDTYYGRALAIVRAAADAAALTLAVTDGSHTATVTLPVQG